MDILTLEFIQIFLQIIVAITIIVSAIVLFTKWLRKKIVNIFIKEIDDNSPSCLATDSIKLSKLNAINLQHIDEKLNNIIINLNDISNKQTNNNEIINYMERSLIRLEILRFIDREPTNLQKISELYDMYKSHGGNSYMDLIYAEHIEKYKNKDDQST